MSSQSVGDVMTTARDRALKAIALAASFLVYAGALIYSGIHNWRLMTTGVPADMQALAAIGVVALEITALALPLALHFWTHSPLQRFWALAFYAIDAGIIVLNVVFDYAIVGGGGIIPEWLTLYAFYVTPASPLFCALGWSVLWLLDPSERERSMIETLKQSTKETLASRIAEAAKSADITEAVNNAAANMAREIVSATLGTGVTFSSNGHKQPANVYQAEAFLSGETDPQEQGTRAVVPAGRK
jgi:hypothetical protein